MADIPSLGHSENNACGLGAAAVDVRTAFAVKVVDYLTGRIESACTNKQAEAATDRMNDFSGRRKMGFP